MNKVSTVLLSILYLTFLSPSYADVDSDFKPDAHERFTIYTGDGYYKQAYRWSFNTSGKGIPITVFLNHGSGGEWYDEIDQRFGPCGPDYTNLNGDFSSTDFEGLCVVSDSGEIVYRADYKTAFVPVGRELNSFMLKKIVGSSKFAAWYWQDAFVRLDSPVNIFMVGRYNISDNPKDFDNVLFWLNKTDSSEINRNSLPPYNFEGYGVDDIKNDNRPYHASPDISAFDNFFLYKAIKTRFPDVNLDNIFIEGRSNGGSAMFSLAADYRIWPKHIKDFWARNLGSINLLPEVPNPLEPKLSLEQVMNDSELSAAFELMLSHLTASQIKSYTREGYRLHLYSNNEEITSKEEFLQVPVKIPNESGYFDSTLFREQLSELLGGDFYHDVKLVHSLYPGCRLDGYMKKDETLEFGNINDNGDNLNGYQIALKTLLSIADQDSLYTEWCNERSIQASISPAVSNLKGMSVSLDATVYSPASHGFDYKAVFKNLDNYSSSERLQAEQARKVIERVINQAYSEIGIEAKYLLPKNID